MDKETFTVAMPENLPVAAVDWYSVAETTPHLQRMHTESDEI